jgi:glycosyltransferase involved in cell wall biosynthesis
MNVLLFANTDWYLYNYRLPLIRAIKERGDQVTLLSPPGRYTQALEKEGFRWLPFPFERKGMNPFEELFTIFRLVAIFRREKPDLVHLFTIKPVLYGSIAARMTGVSHAVNSITGLGYIFSNAIFLLRVFVIMFYRLSLSKTSVIFQNTDDLQYFVQNRIISNHQATLIPGSGVDVNVFHPVREPDGEPVVLIAGRLLRSKGIPEFVNAARQLRSEGIQATFVIVGEPYPDNPDSILPSELASWQEEGVIEAWGWHDDMAEVLAKSSLVCLPTTYKEGLPRLLLEAGASSRPVIATDIPGCRMVVRDGENGLLIPPGNQIALVTALKTLIQDPGLRQSMGARGREIVEQGFSVNQVIARTFDVYNQCRP